MRWSLNPLKWVKRCKLKECNRVFFAKTPSQQYCTPGHRIGSSKETKEKVKLREQEITRILQERGLHNDYFNRDIVRDEIRDQYK